MSRAATPAIAALVAAGVPHEVLTYHHDARAESFGEEAVAALADEHGLLPEQIFKTLVIAGPSGLGAPKLGIAVVPVPCKLSLKAAAAALGWPRATMAERSAAERSTGYVLGGISPLGQRKRLPTVVDASALEFDRVLCSAGKRGSDLALAPDDLVRLTGAVTADIQAV
ncbi:MAG TPA: aminoacyl-tRNA deacylase [Mycobacterium sp.]|uniref:aminoacyl-tRNA deacylase n=1 Tax=Mycolicibacterium sp. TaxID=2320850 RepID=UPI0025F52B38|nr:aminoacyl-tRNA deacylase [Mycolicibacterium sp.]HPX38314.1 aminoacyl-tRNA deacylase [Mycobacterium sp.]HQC78300.1 aminoacyl-tRNA deacylase [Mycobacterium sp.]